MGSISSMASVTRDGLMTGVSVGFGVGSSSDSCTGGEVAGAGAAEDEGGFSNSSMFLVSLRRCCC